ncbi:unnamed protein product [Schistosoma curassoni]|uniref:Uncharacterized protein n=1 Tax=Schistosoma curassoni TaxID=6186 RepID=A0A183JNJ0_9TREM|nr:unnamed protein product [Schistosoma curassoni]
MYVSDSVFLFTYVVLLEKMHPTDQLNCVKIALYLNLLYVVYTHLLC